MSLLGNLLASLFGNAAAAAPDAGQSAQRLAEWEAALQANRLPSFVAARLDAAAAGRAPWVATMSAAELGLARRKGIRPLAMVSGTCWFHYGYSWTQGHADGWHTALARLQTEARALGANAVVDVRMRRIQLAMRDSMDFTLLGTAVRIDGLPAGEHPVVATVPALEFTRLIEAGIVPVGIAIGAQYQYLPAGSQYRARRMETGGSVFQNAQLPELSRFWEGIRRRALMELYNDGKRQGSGVLAHTHLGQLIRIDGDNNVPPQFLGRHIVIGTVVEAGRAGGVPHEIQMVVDMRDELSPLLAAPPSYRHNAYPVRDEEGAI